jgi:hypothetical protein
MDISYLTIDGHKEYVDYEYPLWLNGFPSIKFNFISDENFYWYIRISTLNSGFANALDEFVPFFPSVGVIGKYEKITYFFDYKPPLVISLSIRYGFN